MSWKKLRFFQRACHFSKELLPVVTMISIFWSKSFTSDFRWTKFKVKVLFKQRSTYVPCFWHPFERLEELYFIVYWVLFIFIFVISERGDSWLPACAEVERPGMVPDVDSHVVRGSRSRRNPHLRHIPWGNHRRLCSAGRSNRRRGNLLGADVCGSGFGCRFRTLLWVPLPFHLRRKTHWKAQSPVLQIHHETGKIQTFDLVSKSFPVTSEFAILLRSCQTSYKNVR